MIIEALELPCVMNVAANFLSQLQKCHRFAPSAPIYFTVMKIANIFSKTGDV